MLDNFSDIERQIFLRKFLFFAVGKPVREVKEILQPGIQYVRRERTIEEPQQIIQRKFPSLPQLQGVRYIMPTKPQIISSVIPSESAESELLGKKMVFDVSEQVPTTMPRVEDRRLTVSMDELSVPIPKKLEGKKPQLSVQLQRQMQPETEQVQKPVVKTAFDKLTPFLDDSKISSIECVPNEALKITRDKEKITTQLILDESEVKQIIQEFSNRTRIPVSEFFKASFQEWQVNAILSDVIGSRFMLTREREFKQLGQQEKFIQEEKEEKIVFKPLQVAKVNAQDVYSSITEEVPKPSLY